MASSRVIPAEDVGADAVFDVIVVGAGAAGFPAAIGAARAGASVVLLEKAAAPGGTFARSLGACWIPDNPQIRRRGIREDRESTLRFLARCARPSRYDPDAPFLGLEPWEHQLMGAYFDHAAGVIEALERAGAINAGYLPDAPDYQTRIPENQVQTGRTTVMLDPAGEQNLLGRGQTRRYVDICRSLGVELRCGHAAEAVLRDGERISGVVARAGGHSEILHGRGGVIFCSGGFTRSRELTRAFLPDYLLATATADGDSGDFLHIAMELGLPLHGMPHAWLAPVPLEVAVSGEPWVSNVFVSPGDSTVYLNRYGRRVVNEKAPYNEVGLAMGTWDPQRLEYPNQLLFMLFDQRVRQLWAPPGDLPDARARQDWVVETMGNYVFEGPHLVHGQTLSDLAAALDARLEKLRAHTGGARLDPGFTETAAAEIARFNEMARAGRDTDFGRGQMPIEQVFFGERRPGNDLPEPLMYPLAARGPYHAVILAAGTLGTKGGPRTDDRGRVIGSSGAPVPGLYAAGNCAASMFAQGYPGGGATIGPAMVFGYRAGEDAAGAA